MLVEVDGRETQMQVGWRTGVIAAGMGQAVIAGGCGDDGSAASEVAPSAALGA